MCFPVLPCLIVFCLIVFVSMCFFVFVSLCICVFVFISPPGIGTVCLSGGGGVPVSLAHQVKNDRQPLILLRIRYVTGKIKKVENGKMGLKELSRQKKPRLSTNTFLPRGKINTQKMRRNINK